MTSNKSLSSEILIPGGHGRAFEVRKGQLLQIVDVEGQQVADLFAFNLHDHHERLSPPHTRTSLRSLTIKVGDVFRSSLRNPVFKVVEDTAKSHDLLIAACDERRYLVDYGVSEHRSCVANCEEVLAPYGISRDLLLEPFNIFQSTRIEADGTLVQQTSPTKAGDYILLRAEMDVIAVISACPMDLNPIGGSKITDIMARIFDA